MLELGLGAQVGLTRFGSNKMRDKEKEKNL